MRLLEGHIAAIGMRARSSRSHGAHGLEVLQRFHGEGAAHAHALVVHVGLVVQRFGGGRLVVGQALQGDVGYFFVHEALAHVAAAFFFSVMVFLIFPSFTSVRTSTSLCRW